MDRIEEFKIRNEILVGYYGSEEDVEIPNGVIVIGENAFRFRNITSVTIPGSVKDIEKNAFYGCDSLKRIIAPALPVEILRRNNLQRYALMGYLTYPEKYHDSEIVEEYRQYFVAQTKRFLPSIFEADLVYGLVECAKQGKITINNFEEEFMNPAWDYSAIECVFFLMEWKDRNITQEQWERKQARKRKAISPNITDIKQIWSYHVLEDGTLEITGYKGGEKEINVPDRIGRRLVSRIGEKCFAPEKELRRKTQRQNMIELRSVVVPEGVMSIGNMAFSGCENLINVKLPDGLCSIGDRAFEYCSSLSYINLPDRVTSIGSGAFACCKSLLSVVIPNNIKTIKEKTFCYCSSLTNVSVPNGIHVIETRAFAGCECLREIVIPDSVSEIGKEAFRGCENLINIKVPEGVYSVGDGAFEYCTSLSYVNLPDSVTSIGRNVFSHCTGLMSVTLPNKIKTITEKMFYHCSRLRSITIPHGLHTIEQHAFEFCSSLTHVFLPSTLRYVGIFAFADCENLNDIVIPDNVITIDDCAFKGCRGLVDDKGFFIIKDVLLGYFGRDPFVKVPNGVKIIGANAFEGSQCMRTITIPNSVTTIESKAFYGCANLRSVIIPDSVIFVGSSAFQECEKLKNVVISKNLMSISDRTFLGCKCLTRVVIPDGITSIGWKAFWDCDSLVKIFIPASVLNPHTIINCLSDLTIYGPYRSDARRYAEALDVPFVDEDVPISFSNQPALFATAISELGLSAATFRILRRSDIYTIQDLVSYCSGVTTGNSVCLSGDMLTTILHIRENSIDEILERLKLLGLNAKVEYSDAENNNKNDTSVSSSDIEKRKEMTVGELNLTIGALDCLKRANINTISNLMSRTSEDLARIRKWKPRYTDEVVKRLGEIGFSLHEKL